MGEELTAQEIRELRKGYEALGEDEARALRRCPTPPRS
jgi:hypothetical protein